MAVEPISLIVSALAAGAVEAARETAGTAVKEAYEGLKGLLKRVFGDEPEAEKAVDEYTDAVKAGDGKPPAAPLEDALQKAGAGDDPDVVRKAEDVLKLADPEGSAAGKYTVTTGAVQGQVVGDHATVTMNFGAPPPPPPPPPPAPPAPAPPPAAG